MDGLSASIRETCKPLAVTTETGNQAEEVARRYLQSQGLKYITRHFSTRFGEIDLIMRDKDTTVFVEVRFRKNKQFGGALESVTYDKQQRLLKTAEYYLQKHPRLNHHPSRFDVIAITRDLKTENIEWIKNAFTG